MQALFWQSITSPRPLSPLKSRFGSLRLLDFSKAKIAFERDEICECDGHTIHKLSQWRLTADLLALRESDCSRMSSNVSSEWLPNYIKATRPILEILKMTGYIPYRPRTVKTKEETHQVKPIRRSYCLAIELADHRQGKCK